MEFHISRLARDKYQFQDVMYSLDGNVIFANSRAVHDFTRQMNERIDLTVFPEKAVRASHINAMGLIDEIFHYLLKEYTKKSAPELWSALLQDLDNKFSSPVITNILTRFCDEFPTSDLYAGNESIGDYLKGKTNGRNNRQIVLEEVILLWLTNNNPACMQYDELFDDSNLAHDSAYHQMITESASFFKKQPVYGPENSDILTMFRKPVEAAPYSLSGQLEYIRNKWGYLLGNLLTRLLGGIDFINEETKVIFGGPGPALIPDYRAISQLIDLETERFSPDKDWMPSLVLMAKNSYVWLDQLSKKYQRSITKLHEIPDEELDFLASSGFTGLWLIGLWQRSKASEQIKKLCGNPEAVASAYSIDAYRIADDLGGEDSFQNLRDRAWKRGIRMASDMVPNHMGIDSDWVLHHPDYFLSLDYSPFPAYSFNGPNLSPDPGIGVQIEDHYYTRSDASVVFKRTNYHTGEVKYIYHGNDGTVMPWNDTAQLNYLLSNVREAVMQIILDVARRTPIIRFDAAMTLAKKHIERLWFPEPGSGGAIPTRSDHALSKADFDRLIPEEFWREVVDRVAREVPDTLLLAEAFWLMEGYFVRTLGMHRVYNSAFMHMLRNEDNASFRTLIKNTLEFDPDILKRYVNFMNNPDEKTAVDQFGSGDKYFGVCTMLATLPGLPMFGHGQLEGFAEKYGMEYRRAYMDERVDDGLIAHHRKVIFPLLRRRSCYSGAENFRLYDFHRQDGSVDEDVYAYTNNGNNEKSLVLYHNKFSDTCGWINIAAPTLIKQTGNKILQADNLMIALGLTNLPGRYLIYRDMNSGLQFIRDSQQTIHEGLYFELHAYEYCIFGEIFEVIESSDTHFGDLCRQLAGNGVPDIFLEMRRLYQRPLINSLKSLMAPEILQQVEELIMGYKTILPFMFATQHKEKLTMYYQFFQQLEDGARKQDIFLQKLQQNLANIGKVRTMMSAGYSTSNSISDEMKAFLFEKDLIKPNLPAFWLWILIQTLLNITYPTDPSAILQHYQDWMLDEFFDEMPDSSFKKDRLKSTLKILLLQPTDMSLTELPAREFMQKILHNPYINSCLGINRSNDILWFNLESTQEWLKLQFILMTSWINAEYEWDDNKKLEELIRLFQTIAHIDEKIPDSQYKVDQLLDLLA